MALRKTLTDHSGMITSYHMIEKAMVNFSGEGSIEIEIAEYANESVRDRLKAGEVVSPLKRHNEYISLGTNENQSFDRAILYPRLRLETATYLGAEDC